MFLSAAGVVALVLRAFLIFRYRFDSDEPQHMHVAWAWSHGLLQYRDVFDNHMPLFQVLSAPLFRTAGDDPNVLYLARLSVLPLFIASLCLVFTITRRLFGRRTAAWATALTAACPPYFLGMLEYRTDDLWVVFWLACIAVLLTNIEPRARAIVAGAFLGLAFAVSMKSILFVPAIAIAAVAFVKLRRDSVEPPRPREVLRNLMILGVTAMILPSTIALFFALQGAWRQFAYCVLWHNASAPLDHTWWRVFWAVPLGAITIGVARRYARTGGDGELASKRLFLFLVCAVYFIVLSAFWPILALESYLPFYPLAVVLVTPLLLKARIPRLQFGPAMPFAAGALLIVSILTTAASGRVWRDDAHEQVSLIRQVLQITRPEDMVMDLKGEALFRRRPYWYVLESITHRKLRNHTLRDDIAASLVRSGTAVLASIEFPAKTRAFVERHYVPWGRLWVVGHPLPRIRVSGIAVPFRIAVPSTYIVVDSTGTIDATVDGVAIGNGIELGRGWHQLVVPRPSAQPLIIWSGVTRSPKLLAHIQYAEDYIEARRTVRRFATGRGTPDLTLETGR